MQSKSEYIIFIILFYITVIGGLNWGFHALGYNLVERFANAVGGENSKNVENGLYYFVALCALGACFIYSQHIYDKYKNKPDDL